MSYTTEDISDLKNNLISYSGIEYLGDIDENCDGEIHSYWKPTIGVYEGFAQFDIQSQFSHLSRRISDLLWEKINRLIDGRLELLVSVNNFNKWLNIQVDQDVNIVDVFELYENEPEFVAVDRDRRCLFAIHVEYPSDGKSQLWVYFYKLKTDDEGQVIIKDI